MFWCHQTSKNRGYFKLVFISFRKELKKVHIQALSFGFSEAMMFFLMAVTFVYGAHLVDKGELEFQNVFK